MIKKPASIDDYLGSLDATQRKALERLRRQIHAAAPQAEECISYQLPAFRQGRVLVAFGAAKAHCSLYPMSVRLIAAHKKDLAGFDTSKGTIRFTPAKPLPAALVRMLVKERLLENAAMDAKRKSPAAKKTGAKKVPAARKQSKTAARTEPALVDFMARLRHPLAADIDWVRGLMLATDPGIHEGVKWNAPSFRTKEWFATIFLRKEDGVRLIFHKGAKVKDDSTRTKPIPDPLGLIEWLASDRCMVTLGAGKELRARRKAFQDIVRAWIAQL